MTGRFRWSRDDVSCVSRQEGFMDTISHQTHGKMGLHAPGRVAGMRRWLALAALGLTCASCSTLQDRPPNPADVQRLAEVQAIAGPPVDSFWFTRMSSFEPIGQADLLVFTTPHEAWLLHLDGTCHNLDFDPFLLVTSHDHRVSTLVDSVHVRHNPIPCEIKEIRPVNAVTLRHVDREKKAQGQPAPDQAVEQPKPSSG
jgi:hypothetical protein